MPPSAPLITVEQRPDFCNVNRGGAKGSPLSFSGTNWNFVCHFHRLVGEPKRMPYGVLQVSQNDKTRPNKFKMAAYGSDVTTGSHDMNEDISEFPGETAMFEVQKHGRTSANTIVRQGE